MRKIGELDHRANAIRFCDYLLTKSISAMAETVDEGSDKWVIWIRDEDQMSLARQEFAEFRQQPDAAKYDVEKQAEQIRTQQQQVNQSRLKLQRKVGGPAWGGAGTNLTKTPRLTMAIVLICVVNFFVTDPGLERPPSSPGVQVFEALKFVSTQDYIESDGDPLASIKKGEIWRVFTPNLLHANIMHLLFNMMALFFLGGAIERLHSPQFLGLMVLATGIVAIVMQAVMPATVGGSPHVLGISGSVYGLFGYLWIRPLVQPTFPNLLPPTTVMIMLGFMVAFIVMPNFVGQSVANIAHVAGLFAGILCAVIAARVNA